MRSASVVAALILTVAVVPYIVFLTMWLRDWRAQRRSRTWSSARGTIVEPEPMTSIQPSMADFKVRNLQFRYAYDVNGQPYEGNCPRFGDTTFLVRDKNTLRARYPVGAVVEVWYDPANPEHSVLERTGARSLGSILLFSGLYGAFMIVALLFASAVFMKGIVD